MEGIPAGIGTTNWQISVFPLTLMAGPVPAIHAPADRVQMAGTSPAMMVKTEFGAKNHFRPSFIDMLMRLDPEARITPTGHPLHRWSTQ